MISENMLGSIPGSIITLQNMNIFAKFVKFITVITHARLVKEEEHGLTTLFSWKAIHSFKSYPSEN